MLYNYAKLSNYAKFETKQKHSGMFPTVEIRLLKVKRELFIIIMASVSPVARAGAIDMHIYWKGDARSLKRTRAHGSLGVSERAPSVLLI